MLLFQQDWENARKAAAVLADAGITARLYAVDLADVPNLQSVIARVAAECGAIDILINCAANRPRTKIMDITVAEWDSVHATNLRALFFLSQAVLPGMVAKGWGRIINIGGIDAYYGKTIRAHNVAAKLGIVGLTRALANEVARHGVTVNAVVPGRINSVRQRPEWYPKETTTQNFGVERIPMARVGENADVAAACLFLATPAAGYITGQELLVTGGLHPLLREIDDEYPASEFALHG